MPRILGRGQRGPGTCTGETGLSLCAGPLAPLHPLGQARVPPHHSVARLLRKITLACLIAWFLHLCLASAHDRPSGFQESVRENKLGRLWGPGQEGPLLKVLKLLNARAVFIGFHVCFALAKGAVSVNMRCADSCLLVCGCVWYQGAGVGKPRGRWTCWPLEHPVGASPLPSWLYF